MCWIGCKRSKKLRHPCSQVPPVGFKRGRCDYRTTCKSLLRVRGSTGPQVRRITAGATETSRYLSPVKAYDHDRSSPLMRKSTLTSMFRVKISKTPNFSKITKRSTISSRSSFTDSTWGILRAQSRTTRKWWAMPRLQLLLSLSPTWQVFTTCSRCPITARQTTWISRLSKTRADSLTSQ